MPLLAILDGFETLKKQLFSYFWSQGKISVFFGEISENRRFFADFFTNDFSFPKSFPTQPKTDFSSKNRPKKTIFWSLVVTCNMVILDASFSVLFETL